MQRKKILSIILALALAIGIPMGLSTSAAASSTDLSDFEDIINSGEDPMDAYQQLKEELEAKMDELKKQIEEQQSLVSGYETDLAGIEAELVTVQEKLSAIEASIDKATEQIVEAEVQIDEAEVRLDERRGYLEDRLVDLYVYGDISMMDVVFSTESFDDFLVLFDLVEMVMEQDQSLLNEINKEIATIEHNKALMEQSRQDLEEMTYEYEDMKRDLQDIQNQKITAMKEAISTKEGYQAMLDAEEAASEQATAMLKEWLKENGDDNLTYGGSMIWPLPSPWGTNWVTSEYGYRYHPLTGTYSFHTGIDIGADGGTPIYAASEGEVIYRGWLGGYGQTVQIAHGDGITTLYGHMSAYGGYGVGSYVVAGDIIGYVGTTGQSSGNHLHFEVRLNGDHTSPWNYLK